MRAAAAILLIANAPALAMEMSSALGPYPMTRQASGTSWQPDAAPHEGLHVMTDAWMLMAHGFATVTLDRQGGPRGGEKLFSSSMGMGMAQRELGPGTFAARAMLSLDPAMGAAGYPLLLQTGETADGAGPLVDRQHPHDFFMELSLSYSLPFGEEGAVFGYAGLPGEPALGPPVFMHRFSGAEFPAAPITHHWLDSTHVSEGVTTLGASWGGAKAEISGFRGREPDQYRWDIETPKLDSYAARLSWNPTSDWALQASWGRLHSPEALEPDTDQDRATASASWSGFWGRAPWQATFAWGRDYNRPGRALDAYLLEATLKRGPSTFMGRLERVDKDELFREGEFPSGTVFTVNALSLGYLRDLWTGHGAALGAGILGTADFLPSALDRPYGKPPFSVMLWLRAKVI